MQRSQIDMCADVPNAVDSAPMPLSLTSRGAYIPLTMKPIA